MHMADALISPAIGAEMWVISAGAIGYCSNRINQKLNDKIIPLMGVLGAFVFAAQMINFSIPATGSSGHLGGGLLLAILLGPHAALLTIASILTIQALFFADGGILALGCNIFNIGVIPCLIAYPIIYKPLARKKDSSPQIMTASLLAATISLQLGSLGVVFQTLLSGISDLTLQSFLLFMQPIHLAIGIVEGLATASIVVFLYKARPDILDLSPETKHQPIELRKTLALIFGSALAIGCILSLYASSLPDGLEWSHINATGSEKMAAPPNLLHKSSTQLQETTAILPGYNFKSAQNENSLSFAMNESTGTSISGFIGSVITLLFASLIGITLKRRKVHLKTL